MHGEETKPGVGEESNYSSCGNHTPGANVEGNVQGKVCRKSCQSGSYIANVYVSATKAIGKSCPSGSSLSCVYAALKASCNKNTSRDYTGVSTALRHGSHMHSFAILPPVDMTIELPSRNSPKYQQGHSVP